MGWIFFGLSFPFLPDERPDQTALELLVEFQARYPGKYSLRQLYTLQERVRTWRR